MNARVRGGENAGALNNELVLVRGRLSEMEGCKSRNDYRLGRDMPLGLGENGVLRASSRWGSNCEVEMKTLASCLVLS